MTWPVATSLLFYFLTRLIVLKNEINLLYNFKKNKKKTSLTW